MRFIRVCGALRGSPLALGLLLVQAPLAAQEAGGSPPDDEELRPIVLDESRHASDPVFDEDITEELEAPPPPPETAAERLRRLFKLYRDAMNDRMYAEADTLAKQIVELTIEINGLDNVDTARAITNLAIAQHGAGDYESAQLNFNASIDIIERISDRLNEDLINPLKGLAAAQLALGSAGQAAETYDRAVHISHVNYGPHNLEQVEVLESLAETYLAAGRFDEAVDIQRRIFGLQARNVPMDSAEILPALRTQARWLHRLQLYDRERYTWRRVISILEDLRGKNDLSLIPPLTSLGQSYLFFSPQEVTYQQPASNTTGEIYLKRALRIAEDNPEADWATKSRAMVALGDYYILTERPNRAERIYRDAWELLSGDPELERVRENELQSLTFLNDARPPRFYGIESGQVLARQPDGFDTAKITYRYSVSQRGRLTNIELIEADPQGFEDMERLVHRELRRAVQRPRIVDGEIVQTDNVTFSHEFFYRPSDLPETVTVAEDPAQ